MHLVVDPEDFTIGDMEDFEDAVGVPLNEALKPVQVRDEDGNVVFGENGRPELEVKVSAKALRHLVWILARRDNPDFTPDDARKVKVAALEIVAKDDAPGNDSSSAANDGSVSAAP